MESYVIHPSGPSVLSHLDAYELDPIELLLYPAADAYVVPELIDLPRFNAALGQALIAYPLFAGRLEASTKGDSPWKIRLPGDGVPVVVAESDADHVYRADTIIKRPLTLAASIDVPAIVALAPDQPLARVKITKFAAIGTTSIALCYFHPLGSAFLATRFLRMVSQLYAGSPATDPPPVYDPFPPTPEDNALLAGIDTTALTSYYPRGTPHPQMALPPHELPVRLDFRFTAAQVAQLRAGTLRQAPAGEQPLPLSRQDCLVALVTACLNKADAHAPPIGTITTVFDYRGVGPAPPNLAGNALTYPATDRITPAGPGDLYAFAAGIRLSLLRVRSPAFLSALLARQRAQSAAAARAGAVLDVASPAAHLMVNAVLRAESGGVHFGHPGQTRLFFGSVPFLRHLKLMRPNPVFVREGGGEGYWRGREADVEATLFVQPAVRAGFVGALGEVARKVGMEGEVEWVDEV